MGNDFRIKTGWLFRIVCILGIIFLCPSCGHDEEEGDEPAAINISDINGEWASQLPGGDIIEFDFNHMIGVASTFTTKEFNAWELSFSGYGGWIYSASSGTMRVSMDKGNGDEYMVDYRIDRLDSNYLTLTNQRLGSTREYLRIKDDYTLLEGESRTIAVHKDWNIEAVESPVIDFSNEEVRALNYGTDLLRVNSGNNSWYIRVTVQPELFLFLDVISDTPADARKKLGTPDNYGVSADGLRVMVYNNPTSSIGTVEIYYDPSSNMICNIVIRWKDKNGYQHTEDFITSHYTKGEMDFNEYYDGPTLYSSNTVLYLVPEYNVVELLNLHQFLNSPKESCLNKRRCRSIPQQTNN